MTKYIIKGVVEGDEVLALKAARFAKNNSKFRGGFECVTVGTAHFLVKKRNDTYTVVPRDFYEK